MTLLCQYPILFTDYKGLIFFKAKNEKLYKYPGEA